MDSQHGLRLLRPAQFCGNPSVLTVVEDTRLGLCAF